MPDNHFLHATLISWQGNGILLQGKSGSGKSDLALRLIENKNAVLVADDIVYLKTENDKVVGYAAANLSGLLEIRGVGIVKYPYLQSAEVNLCVNLVEEQAVLERMPEKRTDVILGLEIARIDLYAKESSAAEKVVAAVRCLSTKREKEDLNA